MSNDYTPRTGSLPFKCVEFFTANPDEQLTLDDIAQKFGAVKGNIHVQLASALDAGLLQRLPHDEHGCVYCGPHGELQSPSAATEPQRATLAKVARGGFRSPRHPMLDISTLKVDTGIPYARQSADGHKWDPLFDLLKKPGESVEVPDTLRHALSTAARKRNKRKEGLYRVARYGKSTARVWRTE